MSKLLDALRLSLPVGARTMVVRRVAIIFAGMTAVFDYTANAATVSIFPTLFSAHMDLGAVEFELLLVLPIIAGLFALLAMTGWRGVKGENALENQDKSALHWADTGWMVVCWFAIILYLTAIVNAAFFGIFLPCDVGNNPVASSEVGFLTLYSNTITFLMFGLIIWRVWSVFLVSLFPLLMIYQDSLPVAPKSLVISATAVALLYAILGASIGTVLLRKASQLDELFAQTEVQRREAAKKSAKVMARQQSDAKIHDWVLSALIPRAYIGDLEPARETAMTALMHLKTSLADQEIPTSGMLIERLQEVDDVKVVLRREDQCSLARGVGNALYAATLEAIKNARNHAGSANTVVFIDSTGGGIRIEVRDDGTGFDPAKLRPGRHGITGSIIARMKNVGGSAAVNSEHGFGTSVVLTWDVPVPALQISKQRNIWEGELNEVLMTVPARLLAVVFSLVLLAVVINELPNYSNRLLPFFGWGIMSISCASLFSSRPNGTVPSWLATLIGIACPTAVGITLWSSVVRPWPEYTAWALGAVTVVCCILTIGRNAPAAWMTMISMTIVTVAWSVESGRGPQVGINLMIGQVLVLACSQLLVFWSGRLTVRAHASLERRSRLEIEIEQHERVRDLMDQRLREVARRAEPLLRQVADGASVSGELGQEMALLEGTLRDEIRASSFTGTGVVQAARAARKRGVDVVLLDDSSGAAVRLPEFDQIASKIALELSNAKDGRFVARLQPVKREVLATIIVESSDGDTKPERFTRAGGWHQVNRSSPTDKQLLASRI